MITGLIINGFLGCINALLSLIPSWSLPADMTQQGLLFSGMIHAFDNLFPVTTLIEIILASVALRGILAGWGAILFIYHQFWGSD